MCYLWKNIAKKLHPQHVPFMVKQGKKKKENKKHLLFLEEHGRKKREKFKTTCAV